MELSTFLSNLNDAFNAATPDGVFASNIKNASRETPQNTYFYNLLISWHKKIIGTDYVPEPSEPIIVNDEEPQEEEGNNGIRLYAALRNVLTSKTLETFMNFTERELYLEGNPQSLLDCFYIRNHEYATEVVNAFKTKIGDIVISRASMACGKYETIVDYVQRYPQHPDSQYLLDAFKAAGMKKAEEVPLYLMNLFFCDNQYFVNTTDPSVFKYDYPLMKVKYVDIHEELHQVLFHPNRISKWIDNGYDLDDYLN